MKKLKYISAVMIALFFTTTLSAQVGIGVSPANINPSAQLDVSSTTKGFLPPRMTEAQRNSIASPAAGLTLWCSNCGTAGELQVYNGTAWTNMIGGAAAAGPVILAIGQSYQGGKIAYIDGTGLHGLIAATEDQTNTTFSKDNGTYNSPGGLFITSGATGTAIGTGSANTDAIIASQGNAGSYAAKACRDYRGGGYTDWFLPSTGELNQLYINRVAVGVTNWGVYWSSTEYNDYIAWYLWQSQPAGSNGLSASYKNQLLQVRPMRSF